MFMLIYMIIIDKSNVRMEDSSNWPQYLIGDILDKNTFTNIKYTLYNDRKEFC